jgi:hypothetical protein
LSDLYNKNPENQIIPINVVQMGEKEISEPQCFFGFHEEERHEETQGRRSVLCYV